MMSVRTQYHPAPALGSESGSIRNLDIVVEPILVLVRHGRLDVTVAVNVIDCMQPSIHCGSKETIRHDTTAGGLKSERRNKKATEHSNTHARMLYGTYKIKSATKVYSA